VAAVVVEAQEEAWWPIQAATVARPLRSLFFKPHRPLEAVVAVEHGMA